MQNKLVTANWEMIKFKCLLAAGDVLTFGFAGVM